MAQDSTITIQLTKGFAAVVDEADLPVVSGYAWRAKPHGQTTYAVASVPVKTGSSRQTTVYLHRVLLGLQPGDGVKVDHRDGNGLNNTRGNLRPASHSQNMGNRRRARTARAQYKGLQEARNGRWVAEIAHNKTRYQLGTYDTQEEAAAAYDKKAVELFGAFARTNFGSALNG